jgi:hypothetical protein
MQLRLEFQENPVADEVSALVAVVRPILAGTLFSLRNEIAAEFGGYGGVKLSLLARVHRPSDGECGICFEYAVHDALLRGEASVTERVQTALKRHCNVKGHQTSSILFGAEKTGALQLIDTAKDLLTPDSALLYGSRGRPVKLVNHIDAVAAALRRPEVRMLLPASISGLWRADLFLGFVDTDKWVGTTVKINPSDLQPSRGLRVGIVPSRQGGSDSVRKDESKNLVVCPLAYDGAFMEVFYRAWFIVKQVLSSDARMPREVALPQPADRQVARLLVERREFPVLEVIEALAPLAQPELLRSDLRRASTVDRRRAPSAVTTVVAPFPKT